MINGKTIRKCSLEEVSEEFVGKIYNYFQILEVYMAPSVLHKSHNMTRWAKCKCICGNICDIELHYVYAGYYKSCGCMRYAKDRRMNTKKTIMFRTPNMYYINYANNTVIVSTTNNPNVSFITDLCSWVWLSNLAWQIDDHGYVVTAVNKCAVSYHSLLLPIPPNKKYVRDHINRNRLDDRYCNLRVITKRGNNINATKIPNTSTGIMGVYKLEDGRYTAKFRNTVTRLYKTKIFDTLEEAVAQRKEWESIYQQIETLDVPRLFLPNGEINVYNFPFGWYPDKYTPIWAILRIYTIPYPIKYQKYISFVRELYRSDEYQNNPSPAAAQPQQQQAVPNQVQQ